MSSETQESMSSSSEDEDMESTEVVPIQSITTIVNGIKTTTVIDVDVEASPSTPGPSPPSPSPCSPTSSIPSPSPLSTSPSSSPISSRLPPEKAFTLRQLRLFWGSLKSTLSKNSTQSFGDITSVVQENESANNEDCMQIAPTEPTQSEPHQSLHFLEIYWNLIKFPDDKTTGTRLTALLKLLWILVVALTTFDTITRIKNSMLDVKDDKSNVERTQAKLVTLAYRITQLLLKVAFIIASTKESSVLTETFKHFNPDRYPKLAKLPYIVMILTLAVSFGCVLGGLGVMELDAHWSIQELTVYHFENTYNRICVWSEPSNRIDNPSTFLLYGLATMGYLMHFASRLVELAIQDLLLLTAMSFFFEVKESSDHMKSFRKKIRTPDQAESGPNVLIQLGKTIMAGYEKQQDMTKEMNEAFGIMFGFIHCTNLTLFVFWAHAAFVSFEKGDFIWAGTEVGVFGSAYALAVTVAIMASGYEEWILNKKTRDVMNIHGSRFMAMLHEITKSPIGIGSGILYINFDFIVKFGLLAFQAFMVLFRAVTGTSN